MLRLNTLRHDDDDDDDTGMEIQSVSQWDKHIRSKYVKFHYSQKRHITHYGNLAWINKKHRCYQRFSITIFNLMRSIDTECLKNKLLCH